MFDTIPAMAHQEIEIVSGNANLSGGLVEQRNAPSTEPLISDERVKEILFRFGNVLHCAIEGAKGFSGLSYGFDNSKTVPMQEDEVRLWDRHFGIREHIEKGGREGQLFVAETLVTGDSRTPPPSSTTNRENIFEMYSSGQLYQVAMEPLNTKDVNYFVTPLAYMDGRFIGDLDGMPIVSGGEGLKRAVLAMQIRTQDAQGRWVYSRVPGTGSHSRILGIDATATAELRFNTEIEPASPNELKVYPSHPGNSFAKASIHNLSILDQLDIPDDSQLRLFFWQLGRFVKRDEFPMLS